MVGCVPESKRGSVAVVNLRVSLSQLSCGGDVAAARPYSGETGQRSCMYRIDNLLTCKKLQSKKDVHNYVTPSLHHSLHSTCCIINIEINNQLVLPEARVGGHGYSSPLICLSVCLFAYDR